ncbi:SigE family RNA polymerase sigma factor [Kineococcus vitellinus]|uniref:SigE family RNA polymerase sigma factor n=1 Tax=Kineococcus vitellinus TaxID=2696565 RepID=UPI00196A9BE8
MQGTFEEFAATSSSGLMRTALLLTGDRAAAEDLLQEVLERVYVRWRSVQDPQAYARTAMSRAVTDRWRRAGRRPREVPLHDWHERAVPDGAADRAARADVVAQLRALPPRQRAVIVLRYFEDWSEERIADELDVSRGTVKSQAAKGLARLRELMGADRQDADVDEEEMSR